MSYSSPFTYIYNTVNNTMYAKDYQNIPIIASNTLNITRFLNSLPLIFNIFFKNVCSYYINFIDFMPYNTWLLYILY